MQLQILSSPPGRRRLGTIAAAAVVVGWLGGSWLLGVGIGGVGAVIQLVLWRIQLRRSMKRGLAVGQSISVAYAGSGELTIRDVTGQVWLPRGSALGVIRKRGLVTVFGRAMSFWLPGELLTDGDIAFLEGHGDAPEKPGAPGPVLPLTIEITAPVQEQLVASATRVRATSADFLMPYLVAPLLLGFAALSSSWPFIVVTAAFCLVCILPTLLWLAKTRRSTRLAYPVGATIKAEVTAEHLALSTPHRTLQTPWSDYRARRLTPHTVLLRRSRRRPDTTETLPRALFTEGALTELEKAVLHRF